MCATPVWMFFRTFFLTFLALATPTGSFPQLLLRRDLLARDGLALALAGARVRVSPLSADGQPFSVSQPAIAADVHQHLDVLLDLAPQIAFHLVAALDDVAQSHDLGLVQVEGLRVR